MLTSIDHFVLTANDMDKTISFYCDVLGMTLEEFTPSDGGEARKSLKFGNLVTKFQRLSCLASVRGSEFL